MGCVSVGAITVCRLWSMLSQYEALTSWKTLGSERVSHIFSVQENNCLKYIQQFIACPTLQVILLQVVKVDHSTSVMRTTSKAMYEARKSVQDMKSAHCSNSIFAELAGHPVIVTSKPQECALHQIT